MAQNILINAPVKIISEEGSKPWAKSFPPGGSRPPFFMGISFDNSFASIYQRWEIGRFEEGYTIKNNGNGFWAYGKDGEVFTSNEFDPSHCKWYIESAGEGIYKIQVPAQDLVWTVKRREPDYPLSVYLAPADGYDYQNFSFVAE
ncbi:hypothetical protein AGABI2DRAFT_134468 [Agaricus bisporus var. bisporus H97]|uniref:hypothetical protein n=1 Tax=Agaricus bisporus var. bisporus (strain H97 / ATCC MYA-4626 / FGSC 10389) TaxID=936046 RepID=UPI00029F7334|nr:hypothetical protein AGABI2DRAFT_134468 [Agaricus bisporus var. bisporus H97]EKV48777.1 hypothetical protein AGABI2DRAFT_134468 [Agaricus bisporus var. bisporus H97]